MNNLSKVIIGMSLLPFAPLHAADEVNLEGALQKLHPEILAGIKKDGLDIAVLEADAAPNPNNGDAKTPAKLPIVGGVKASPADACRNVGGVFLANNYIATCVSKNGTFGYSTQSIGMTFNPAGGGTVTAPDFLAPGSPHEYFSIKTVNTLLVNNNITPDTASPFQSVTIAPLNRYASTPGGVLVNSVYGPVGGYKLDMRQKYTVDPNSREIIVEVAMHNTGSLVLTDMMYARGLDPDQQRPSSFATLNHIGHTYGGGIRVHPDNIAWAGSKPGLSVALYSVDPMAHKACISSTWTEDPQDVLNLTCGNPQPVYNPTSSTSTTYSDDTINIAFKLGDLQPGEEKVFSFKYLFHKK